MSLSARQLAKLRELARTSNELELRHDARRAAIATQRDYIATLNRKLDQLPRARNALLRNTTTEAAHDIVEAQFRQDEAKLRDEILTARAEFEQLQDQLSQITQVSAPLRDLIERILQSSNLSRHEAGVAFGDDEWRPRESITVGAN